MLTFQELIDGKTENPNIATSDILAEIRAERQANNRANVKEDLMEMMETAEETITAKVRRIRELRKSEKREKESLDEINAAHDYMVKTGNPYPLFAIVNPWECGMRLRNRGFWDDDVTKLEDQPLVKMV